MTDQELRDKLAREDQEDNAKTWGAWYTHSDIKAAYVRGWDAARATEQMEWAEKIIAMGKDRDRLRAMCEKLAVAIPLLQASTDAPQSINAVYLPPSMQLKAAAEKLEQKDKIIFQAREALAEYEKMKGEM